MVAQAQSPPVQITMPQTQKERAYFTGKGELKIKKTEHRGAGRKAASWLALGPVGYLAFGRDKTRKTEAKGELVVTDKAIYVAGNDYPYDEVLAMTRKGGKEIELTFEAGVTTGERISIESVIRVDSKDECNTLFDALQKAKMSQVSFSNEPTQQSPAVVIQREVVRIKCKHCGTLVDPASERKCPSCGAPAS